MLIDSPQSAAGTADAPRNGAALISTGTDVSKASPSMSSLRVKGYCLPYPYGFIDLKRQLTDSTLQCLVFWLRASIFCIRHPELHTVVASCAWAAKSNSQPTTRPYAMQA